MSRSFDFVTLDVFTDRRFGGNPLAVFPDAAGMDDATMQAVAQEMNLSETTFVLPPDDAAHDARVRIFTPAAEVPFAGHPNVGTGFLLAGRRNKDRLLFEEAAGIVAVTVARDATGAVDATTIAAPAALAIGAALPVAIAAGCASLAAADLVDDDAAGIAPCIAGVGLDFMVAELRDRDALARARPDHGAFATLPAGLPGGIAVFVRTGADAVALRMFAPAMGVGEDPATGSAAAALVALLLSRVDAAALALRITQGDEIGRPSRMRGTARRAADGAIRAEIGGPCVPVLAGTLTL